MHGGVVRKVDVVVLDAEHDAGIPHGGRDPGPAGHGYGQGLLRQDVASRIGAGDCHLLVKEVRERQVDEVTGRGIQQLAIISESSLYRDR